MYARVIVQLGEIARELSRTTLDTLCTLAGCNGVHSLFFCLLCTLFAAVARAVQHQH